MEVTELGQISSDVPTRLDCRSLTNQNSVLDDRKYQKCENLPF